ncbi:MAG: glutamyl-tRNA reductase, partial [Gammaproteobacteria bacterium]
MPLIAVGLSHRTAPLELRERVVFDPQRLREALRELNALPGVEEGAILSTCNRTEVYCAVNGTESAAVSEWLARHHQLSSTDLEAFLYIHQDDAAVRHIFRVASGLDSMILGEPQILGQIKDAYQDATAAGTLHQRLSKLFQ